MQGLKNWKRKRSNMPRPRITRRIRFAPGITYFRPRGAVQLAEAVLTMDELEAVRLNDYEEIDQEVAAKKMGISQPTFHRLLLSARRKIADALVNGKAIKIEGGVYKMMPGVRGRGRGRMGGFAAGPGGSCVCSKCGAKAIHHRGVPCYQQKCPKCGSSMTRG
jgi:predicted DNA-binding protein (UPF0251 family)